MVNVTEVRALAERLARAEALVAAGAVFPVAGLEAYAVVRNGDGSQMYLVRIEAGHETCTCPDYRERQSKVGMPCKHIMAAELVAAAPKPAEPKVTKTSPKVDGAVALARLQGDDDADPWNTPQAA